MLHMRLFTRSLLVAAIALTASASCKKEERSGVPYTTVDITINVNNPAYADIQVPGGWVYLSGGSLGILVYRKTIDQFMAYDRHCPYQPENLCHVIVDDSQVMVRDTLCCGSAFVIVDGSVAAGPASTNLRQYNTMFNGTSLRIYN